MGDNFRTNTNKPKLLDEIRNKMQASGYSRKTIIAYTKWIREYILYFKKRHPSELQKEHVEQFLTYLSVDRRVSASTQSQALAGLLYLYKNIIERDIGWLDGVIKSKRSRRLPVVFTKEEAKIVIDNMSGVTKLIVSLLYGSGLRLSECLNLRVLDIDIELNAITVRRGKGDKDRTTVLPKSIKSRLVSQLNYVKSVHYEDLKRGYGEVDLPYSLSKKYPNAANEFKWQYVFPSEGRTKDHKTGKYVRHHLHESSIQKAVKRAVELSAIEKKASCHTFRHLAHEI